MNPSRTETASPLAPSNSFVSGDFMALASHMTACRRSRGRFFSLKAAFETLQALTAPRLVTTGAVCVLCSVGLLGLGLLSVA